MNKKGFTLVEILAVIAILALIITISGISIVAIRNNSLNDLRDEKVTEAINSAIIYGQENPNDLTETCTVDGVDYNFCKTITIGELLDRDYNESSEGTILINGENHKDVYNNVTNKSMRCDTIIIYRKNNRIYATKDNINSDSDLECKEEIINNEYKCNCK